MSEVKERRAAQDFANFWQGKGYEKGQSQPFWLSLLRDVLGVEHPEQFISFEEQVKLDHTSFIDGTIAATHVLIEQKSLGRNLKQPIRQSDGSLLTPFEQAKRYAMELPYSQRPRWIVACNFEEFHIYDMEKPFGEAEVVLLKDLPTEYYRLKFLVDAEDANIKREMQVSMEAGDIVGRLYDALLARYVDAGSERSLKSLNMLCVRLVFCLYAEDAGIFGAKNMFHDYLEQFPAKQLRGALIELFKVLDTQEAARDPYLEDDLKAFPYVNGGLFADEDIEIPQFTEEIRSLLLMRASEDFDWSRISPTIFGAVFESTLNPATRRSGGMHYTSIENIHKVIDPLFLDDLQDEFAKIKEQANKKKRRESLEAFQKKLVGLTFLDPACGSGNFLTETYLCLRRLENEVIRLLTGGEIILGELLNPIQVSIRQFYGIEINDFAVAVAKTALWIAESQMLQATEDIIHLNLDFLPLKTNANIIEGNALRLDWEKIVPKEKLNYIMGNPPFVGARLMAQEQKSDLLKIFDGIKSAGNLDYVSCWYKKAADYMRDTKIRTALVSTNSITQGEQVAILWQPLFKQGVHIDFAHRTFRWDSEASIKAHVHCVIVGFSCAFNSKSKIIYSDNQKLISDNINGYLLDAPPVFINSRITPICDVPKIGMGNQPIDDGNYLFSKDEMEEFIIKEPKSSKLFRKWFGSYEFINRKPRYCLWLGDLTPAELRKLPQCLKLINAVKEYRLKSKRSSTLKLADKPTRFQTENMPDSSYIVIPEVSSERRKYVPIGFMSSDVLCSNKLRLMPNANMFEFGVLTSNVHMAWMRTVAGRLEMRYDYSIRLVYNNFPWPTPTEAQKEKIERTAQGILDARALYPESSLADLYDELTMPKELRDAHRANDRAVMEAYGFWGKLNSEAACVAELMKMYQKLAGEFLG